MSLNFLLVPGFISLFILLISIFILFILLDMSLNFLLVPGFIFNIVLISDLLKIVSNKPYKYAVL